MLLNLWKSLGPLSQSGLVVLAAVILYLGWRVVFLSRLQRLAASTENDLDDRLILFVKRFAGIVLLFLAVLAILEINGIEVSPLLAGAGIAGIAIAFAAKETLSDILAGIFLIADRPMRIGDRVKIEHIGTHWGGWGDVVDIGLRRTTVRNTDGVIVNYPNHVLANSVITNFSFDTGPTRVRVRFHVRLDADLRLAQRVAQAAAEAIEGIATETVQVVVRSLWDDDRGHQLEGVLMEVRYRIEDVRDRTRIRSELLIRLKDDLAAAGVPLSIQRIEVVRPSAR